MCLFSGHYDWLFGISGTFYSEIEGKQYAIRSSTVSNTDRYNRDSQRGRKSTSGNTTKYDYSRRRRQMANQVSVTGGARFKVFLLALLNDPETSFAFCHLNYLILFIKNLSPILCPLPGTPFICRPLILCPV